VSWHDSIEQIESPALARLPLIVHGFFTRTGGVSQGIYASLNCGYGSGDCADAVTENRARALAALGLKREALVTVLQSHSTRVATLTRTFAPGDAPAADAMVTDKPGIALGILAADCVPVLFADPAAKVIGAAHAGWRGTLDGVLEETLSAMERLGASRARIEAAIGPAIQRDSYEVGAALAARFKARDAESARFFSPAKRAEHFQCDLPAYAEARLARAGVARVDRLSHCTYAEAQRFFSYRRATHRGEEDYGRNLSLIALTP
jgi:hypothetical protein